MPDSGSLYDGLSGYVAVTEVDGWSLTLEANGITGVLPDVIVPLSR